MTSTQQWMTRRQYTRLQNELARLRSRPGIEGLDDFVHHDAKLRLRHATRQLRIAEIEDLLNNAVIDGNPVGAPVAEAGMVLTIRYDDTGKTETFLLGGRSAEGSAMKAYSMVSPLGCSIAGARPGDQRVYAIPHGAGRPVTLLEAVPHRMHATKPPSAIGHGSLSCDAPQPMDAVNPNKQTADMSATFTR